MRLHDLFEEQTLLEVNMSPSALRLMASKIDARAGMEFEIIVKGASVEDSGDLEEDNEADEAPESIRHICDFFENNDWGVDNNVQRLERDLRSDFNQWLEEGKLNDAWAENEHAHVYEWVVNNADEDEIREHLGYEEDEPLSKSDYNSYTEYCIEEHNDLYEEAYQDFRDDFYNMDLEDLEAEWLHEEGYDRTMYSIQRNYNNTDWPYMRESGNGGDDIATVADEFENIIDRRVRSSGSYHSATRNNTDYIVEPDSSLDADDSESGGLEFVSPPLPLTEMLDDLRKVVAWCKERGNYTNDSTGLHMNVSVPGYTLDKLDYVKLALFLGDEYVLKQFGREGNTYCKSALQKVRNNIRPENREHVLNRLSSDLSSTASKVIHSGITDKYTSINTKDKYIEFRSPGGDWLNTDIDQLENTLLRFVVALSIAIDPEAHKQEYAKKLYKLLSPADDGTNTLQLFAEFKAGKIDRDQLIRNVKSASIQRNIKSGKVTGQFWWRVEKEGRNAPNGAVLELIASSKEEALQKAADEWNTRLQSMPRISATPLRPYDTSAVKARVGEPEPVGRQNFNNLTQTDYENRLGWPDQTGDANYEIVDRRTMSRQMVFIANTPQDAERKYTQWLDVAGFPHDTENFGWRPIQ